MTAVNVEGDTFRRIADAYSALAAKRAAGLPFVSDWNGAHGHVRKFLGALANTPLAALGELTNYAFPQEDFELHQRINAFHLSADGTPLRPSVLLLGGGATSMLAVIVQMLRAQRRTHIHYLAPLHYTLTAILDREGISAISVANRQAFEPDFDLQLPQGHDNILVLSDPIWHVGRPLPVEVIDVIRDWQDRTGSLVIIDGTFQYLGWEHRAEASSGLNPDLTVRLVCPTKALSLNGFRFSYLILPKPLFVTCATAQDLYHGTTSLSDHLFAHAAITALTARAHEPMLHEARQWFSEIRARGRITDLIVPLCGYFAFVKPDFDPGEVAAMGPEHFGMAAHDGWIRVNLMNPEARRVLMP